MFRVLSNNAQTAMLVVVGDTKLLTILLFDIIHWWLIRVTLVIAIRYAPIFWEEVGTDKLSFSLKLNTASEVMVIVAISTIGQDKIGVFRDSLK